MNKIQARIFFPFFEQNFSDPSTAGAYRHSGTSIIFTVGITCLSALANKYNQYGFATSYDSTFRQQFGYDNEVSETIPFKSSLLYLPTLGFVSTFNGI